MNKILHVGLNAFILYKHSGMKVECLFTGSHRDMIVVIRDCYLPI